MTTQPVTEREAQVLALLGDRLSNQQIAHQLRISVRTVEHHVSALLRKHGAADRRELAAFADRVGTDAPQRLAGLPTPHTSFVGRAAERELVRAALDGGRLVTLLGPGGVGKTRLAIAVAELVARVLAGCPAAVVLATSRERLRVPGEQSVPVDPLPVPGEAVALFRDRAAAVDPRFSADPATVARICTRLDGMPLAIELAAARAPALGAGGLLTALEDTVRVLAGGRNPDPRHRSLRAVIDWSHQLLDEPEQALFRRLAIFVGQFDLTAATAAAGAGDTTAVADLLGRLVDKNLVVYVPRAGRWRLLDTVRAYARQQLAAADEQAPLRRRHLRWAERTATALEQRLDGDWRDEFDAIVDDLRAALRDLPPGPEQTAHRLARSLGHLTYARALRRESVDRYRQAAGHAPTPAAAAADLRAAADCAAATYRADLHFELLLAAAEKAGQAGDGDTRASLLARAADVGRRYEARLPVPIPPERLRGLYDEAVAAAGSGSPFTTAAISITAAWIADPPRLDPDLAERALAAARAAGDPVLIWAAIDTVTSVYEHRGQLRRAYQLTRTGLPLLAELDRDDPRAGATINSIHHMTAIYAIAAGDLSAAIAIGRAAAGDPVAAEPISLGSMLVPPLVLTGEFDEALRHADAMWHAWETGGRATAGWLWFPAAAAALALGLTGDQDGYRRWRDRMSDFAGPHNTFRLRTASSARFADARMAVHTGELTDAPAIVAAAFSDPSPGGRYRVFSQATAAELAVVAGLPDAPRYLDAAAGLAAENGWASACLARARGRYHRDPEALRESIAGWERVGAHFERACTRQLLREHTDQPTDPSGG